MNALSAFIAGCIQFQRLSYGSSKNLGTKIDISNKACSELSAWCFDDEAGKKCTCQWGGGMAEYISWFAKLWGVRQQGRSRCGTVG